MSDEADGIRDQREQHRFVLEIDGAEAELVYRRRGDRLILVHTGVPDSLGGQGIGGQLVRAAVTAARAEQLTIVPWCPFARKWLQDHPDEVEGLEIDWDTPPPASD